MLQPWPARLTALCLLAAAGSAFGQQTLSPEQARTAADGIATLVRSDYVFPEQRSAIADAVSAAAAAGRYDTDNPDEFSERITEDMRAAGHDMHLWVHFDPDAFRDLQQHSHDAGTSPLAREANRRRNGGFEDFRILDGNLRYVRITNFLWCNDSTGRIIDEVARFLGDGDAVLIDLRGNGGGDAGSVERLISYFFPGDDRILMRFQDGLTHETMATRVANDLPSPRMVGKPLYVLIDGGTGSAAEEFAYHVQQFKLGVLVGEVTAGAANNNEMFPVAPGFVASVSVGRPVHPISQTNWEGVGVSPTIETPAPDALDHAELLALQELARTADAAERLRFEWPMALVEARLHPIVLSPSALADFVGRYGSRTVQLQNGTLVYQRDGGDPTTLAPLGPDLFAFANTADVRIRFRRAGGTVVGFDQITSAGEILPSERTE